MRLVSSVSSVRQGEVSFLAITETIAATTFSFWYAFHVGTIRYFVIASAIAPLLLLKTPLTALYAGTLCNFFGRKAQRYLPFYGVQDAFALLSIPLAKFVSTAYITLRRPLQAVQAIPLNFTKNAFSVDLAYPPQFIPGLDETVHRDQTNDAYHIIREVFRDPPPLPLLILVLVIYAPPVLSAILYRWAMKSTALLWLPLIWIVVQSSSKDIFVRLKIAVRSSWARIMLGYSLLTIVAFVARCRRGVGRN